MDRRFLSLKDASAFAGLSVRALRRYIAQGRLPAYKPGKKLLLRADELESFLDRSRVSNRLAQTIERVFRELELGGWMQ